MKRFAWATEMQASTGDLQLPGELRISPHGLGSWLMALWWEVADEQGHSRAAGVEQAATDPLGPDQGRGRQAWAWSSIFAGRQDLSAP